MPSITGQWQEFVMGSDSHGDQIDAPTARRFLAFLDEFKPKILVHGGDAFDVRPFRKGAEESERRESMATDINAGLRFLESMMDRQADNKVLLMGNHDDRLVDMAKSNSGPASDYAADCMDRLETLRRRLGVKSLPYDKRSVLKIGSLKMLHGMFCGASGLRNSAAVYGSCLTGHVHTIAEYPIPGLTRRVARSIGCLCKLDPEYASRKPNSMIHAHGWAYGAVNRKTGLYFVNQAEEVGGIWNFDVIKR